MNSAWSILDLILWKLLRFSVLFLIHVNYLNLRAPLAFTLPFTVWQCAGFHILVGERRGKGMHKYLRLGRRSATHSNCNPVCALNWEQVPVNTVGLLSE